MWCGVDSPTPTQVSQAELAAKSAEDTIRHFRGLAATDAFESAYLSLALEMGVYAYEKRGVDGTVSFSENGVQRSYEDGSFPQSMTSRITPKAKTG